MYAWNWAQILNHGRILLQGLLTHIDNSSFDFCAFFDFVILSDYVKSCRCNTLYIHYWAKNKEFVNLSLFFTPFLVRIIHYFVFCTQLIQLLAHRKQRTDSLIQKAVQKEGMFTIPLWFLTPPPPKKKNEKFRSEIIIRMIIIYRLLYHQNRFDKGN